MSADGVAAPMPYAERRGRLLAATRATDGAGDHEPPDAVLVTRLVNVRYLTGFTGSHAALLVGRDGAVLATDGRYRAQAGAEVPDLEVVVDRKVAEALVARAGKDGVRRLAVEEHDLSVEAHRTLSGMAAADGTVLVGLGRAVEELRRVKDDAEVAMVREACRISISALEDLRPTIAPGRTERDIALDLEHRMLRLGAEALAFATIVAGGPHSAIPHHRPTDRPLERGDLLKIDFGARHGGYHADCTRTFVVGAEPAGWQRDLHALVAAAQRAGREALAVGAETIAVDRAARSVVEDAGMGEHFPHGLGHGVGLEIHEQPLMGYEPAGRLRAGIPLTVEPGVYLPGRGGVRIEDTLVVRDDGPELLTDAPRDLLVL